MENLAPVISWAAPIVSTLIITACTALINRWIEQSKKDAEREQALAEREREADRKWRENVEQRLLSQAEWAADRQDWFDWRRRVEESYSVIDDKLDKIRGGTQTTMRTDLIHLYEKFTTRGWITPEEKAAWFDMHAKYSALDANGLIDSYKAKLESLPEREID